MLFNISENIILTESRRYWTHDKGRLEVAVIGTH